MTLRSQGCNVVLASQTYQTGTLKMIDYSPADETPLESAITPPYGPVTVDVDGSLTGCQSCGRAFGRFDSRATTVFAGDVYFRHTSC